MTDSPSLTVLRRRLAIAALPLLTWVVFGQTLGFDFINFDDGPQVFENPHIQAGLTWSGVRWALCNFSSEMWIPLTRLSQMLDREVFGPAPGGFHFTNVALHLMTGLVLTVAMERLTRRFWPSYLVALLFTLHPLRVESVAWISERKDVLSGLWFALALTAYAAYARHPHWTRSASVLACFVCGLLSKPMLITFPFLLLLLDIWPLERFVPGRDRWDSAWPLLREKLPLFALTVVFVILAFMGQHRVGAIQVIPFGSRLANAIVSYGDYLRLTAWPSGLGIYYPFTEHRSAWTVLLVGTLLLTGTVLVLRRIVGYPMLAVGWFWFLGLLVPVIGFTQIGAQARADRYMYLPQIGVWCLIVFGLDRLLADRRGLARAAYVAGLMIVGGFASAAWHQTGYWRDSETLYLRTLSVTRDNWVIHNNLGNWYLSRGRTAEAELQLKAALRITPAAALTNKNLGDLNVMKGNPAEAAAYYRRAIQTDGTSAEIAHGLGLALAMQGQTDEAIGWYERALVLSPGFAEAHINLGLALAAQKRSAEAIAHYAEALELDPTNASAHNNWGYLLLTEGRPREALPHFEEALRLDPNYVQAKNNLDTARLALQ